MALERFDPTTQLANVKQIFWGVTETPKIVEQPIQIGMKKVYPLDKATIQQRWREMTPVKTDDPVVSYLNNNAPEWFMVDLPKAEKVIRFTKEKHPELEWEDVIKKAVEYLPWIKQYEDEQRQWTISQPQQTPMQWGIRRWVAWFNSLEWTALAPLEPVNKLLDEANLLWKLTQFIDNNVQKIPTISRESMAKALKWTPFEGMEVLPTMVANTPWSLLKTASATARGITNPFDTIIGLSKLVMTPEWRQAVIDRYGSIEWLKQTMTEDPVGLASDVLTLVQGWAGIASKWAKIAWMADTASTLWNISNVAWWAADLWLSTAIPQGLQKASQFGDEIWQRWLLGTVWKKAIQWFIEPVQPMQMAKDIYSKVEEFKPVEKVARKILWATDDQSKLFKAQEPRTWQLNKSIDRKNLRKQSDIANEEIVRYWYKPVDTATRAEAHANTMQQIRDKEIKARIGTEFDIDLNNVADKMDEFIAKQADAGLVKNKAQLAELQAQSKAFREMWTVDWAKWEFIKEMINAQINNWWDASIWDVYKNGMKEATRQLWANLDEAFSRIPWEFADAKKRFWALKATYADVVKADIKAQKAKWAWLTETFSRIEWFGDLLDAGFGILAWKNPLPKIGSWLWKLAVGKVLQKIKDKDFLIQEWFEWLSKKAGQIAPVVKAETNRKALPMIEWSMEFQTPVARIGSNAGQSKQILETWLENVKQPMNWTSQASTPTIPANSPLVKANQKVSPKKKTPLIKATPMSKVDDALPWKEKMDSRLIIWKKYSLDEMIDLWADWHLQNAQLQEIPLNKIWWKEPTPSMEWSFKWRQITQPIEVSYDKLNDEYILYAWNHRVTQAEMNWQDKIIAFVENYKDVPQTTNTPTPAISKTSTPNTANVDLLSEARKYDSAEDYIDWYKSSKIKVFEDNAENIDYIQSIRHDLHSYDADWFYKSNSWDFWKYEEMVDNITDYLDDTNILWTEKEYSKKIQTLKNKIEDLDTDYEWYSEKVYMKVYKQWSDIKEKINDIIEEYLNAIEEKYIKEWLNNYSSVVENLRLRSDSFAPSWRKRARSILGDWADNTTSVKRYDVDMDDDRLRKIREEANKTK